MGKTLLKKVWDFHTVRTLPSFAKVAGHDVTIWKDHTKDVDVLATRLKDTEALCLIRERTPIRAPLLDRLDKLRLISQVSVYPHVDVEACTRRGVILSSSQMPGQPSYATAELTWGLVIAAMRRIPQEVAALLVGRGISGVPVVDQDRVVGIVSESDLLPLREERPDQLVFLTTTAAPGRASAWSFPVWDQLRQRPQLFQAAAAWSFARFNQSAAGAALFVEGLWASGSFFDALGVRAIVGRTFSDADDRRDGGPQGPVAVVSYSFWQRRFGGDDAIGRELSIDSRPMRVAEREIGHAPIPPDPGAQIEQLGIARAALERHGQKGLGLIEHAESVVLNRDRTRGGCRLRRGIRRQRVPQARRRLLEGLERRLLAGRTLRHDWRTAGPAAPSDDQPGQEDAREGSHYSSRFSRLFRR